MVRAAVAAMMLSNYSAPTPCDAGALSQMVSRLVTSLLDGSTAYSRSVVVDLVGLDHLVGEVNADGEVAVIRGVIAGRGMANSTTTELPAANAGVGMSTPALFANSMWVV